MGRVAMIGVVIVKVAVGIGLRRLVIARVAVMAVGIGLRRLVMIKAGAVAVVGIAASLLAFPRNATIPGDGKSVPATMVPVMVAGRENAVGMMILGQGDPVRVNAAMAGVKTVPAMTARVNSGGNTRIAAGPMILGHLPKLTWRWRIGHRSRFSMITMKRNYLLASGRN